MASPSNVHQSKTSASISGVRRRSASASSSPVLMRGESRSQRKRTVKTLAANLSPIYEWQQVTRFFNVPPHLLETRPELQSVQAYRQYLAQILTTLQSNGGLSTLLNIASPQSTLHIIRDDGHYRLDHVVTASASGRTYTFNLALPSEAQAEATAIRNDYEAIPYDDRYVKVVLPLHPAMQDAEITTPYLEGNAATRNHIRQLLPVMVELTPLLLKTLKTVINTMLPVHQLIVNAKLALDTGRSNVDQIITELNLNASYSAFVSALRQCERILVDFNRLVWALRTDLQDMRVFALPWQSLLTQLLVIFHMHDPFSQSKLKNVLKMVEPSPANDTWVINKDVNSTKYFKQPNPDYPKNYTTICLKLLQWIRHVKPMIPMISINKPKDWDATFDKLSTNFRSEYDRLMMAITSNNTYYNNDRSTIDSNAFNQVVNKFMDSFDKLHHFLFVGRYEMPYVFGALFGAYAEPVTQKMTTTTRRATHQEIAKDQSHTYDIVPQLAKDALMYVQTSETSSPYLDDYINGKTLITQLVCQMIGMCTNLLFHVMPKEEEITQQISEQINIKITPIRDVLPQQASEMVELVKGVQHDLTVRLVNIGTVNAKPENIDNVFIVNLLKHRLSAFTDVETAATRIDYLPTRVASDERALSTRNELAPIKQDVLKQAEKRASSLSKSAMANAKPFNDINEEFMTIRALSEKAKKDLTIAKDKIRQWKSQVDAFIENPSPEGRQQLAQIARDAQALKTSIDARRKVSATQMEQLYKRSVTIVSRSRQLYHDEMVDLILQANLTTMKNLVDEMHSSYPLFKVHNDLDDLYRKAFENASLTNKILSTAGRIGTQTQETVRALATHYQEVPEMYSDLYKKYSKKRGFTPALLAYLGLSGVAGAYLGKYYHDAYLSPPPPPPPPTGVLTNVADTVARGIGAVFGGGGGDKITVGSNITPTNVAAAAAAAAAIGGLGYGAYRYLRRPQSPSLLSPPTPPLNQSSPKKPASHRRRSTSTRRRGKKTTKSQTRRK